MTRKLWISAAAALALGLTQSPALAQYGPPSTGPNSAVITSPGTVYLVAGLNGQATAGSPSTWGNGGLATAAQLNFPIGIAYDSNGNLYLADSNDYEVRKISATTGIISDFAGTGNFSNSPTTPTGTTQATTESFGILSGLAIDSSNNVYFADRTNNIIWKVNTSGVISIFAGTGSGGYTGDTGPATSATIQNPQGLAVDANGNVYIADSNNNVIRIVGTNGKINTFAGNGTGHGQFPTCPSTIPTLGTSTAATSVAFCQPQGVAADSNGNIYISSYDQVYKVTTGGIISVFAGSGADYGDTNCCNTGDGGMATSAQLSHPMGLYADPAGDVYIVDQGGAFIREVNTAGVISTVYGDGSGDVTKAIIGTPDDEATSTTVGDADGIYFITMDPDGNLVVPSADASAVLSAGSTGNYFFGHNNQIYTTATSTSENAAAPNVYPPYIVLSNPSGVTLQFTAVPTVTGPFGLDGGTCGFPGTLAPGDSCTIIPSFTPTQGGSPGTLANGTITIPSNANNVTQSITTNNSPLTINLSGYGIGSPTPSATLLPALSFTSSVGVTSAPKTVTLTNNGTAPLYLTSTQFTNNASNPYAVSGTTCPNSTTALAVNATCTYSITFDPSAATGYPNGFQVDVQYYNTSNTLVNYGFITVNLSGTGMGALTLTPVSFGDVVSGATSTLVATFTNGTQPAMTGATYSITGLNASNFAIVSGTNSCGSQVNGAGGTCNIYVAFTPSSATTFSATLTASGTNSSTEAAESQTASLTGSGVIFSSNVGTAEAMQLVTINFTTAGTLNFVHAFTQGIPNLDYTATSGGTCDSVTTVTVGQSCTVEVIFDPTAPGIRNGALVVTDSSNNVLGTTYLAGLGIGPQIVFGPPVQSNTLPASTYDAEGAAVDASGNLYVTDGAHNTVNKFPKSGSGYGSPISIGSGYNQPIGVAVDGAGNVYVGNYAGLDIVKIPWNGTSYGTQTTVPLAAGEHQPKHLALDGFGNIYFADYVGGYCAEVPWNGTSYGASFDLPFTGINSPNGVAVDVNGDVFCASTYTNSVVMLPKTSSGFGTQVTVASGLVGRPIDVALDAHGDVYVADQPGVSNTGEALLEVPFSAGTYGTPVNIPVTGLAGVQGVTVDGLGNIYVSDYTATQVFRLDVSDPPALSFAPTNVGSKSSDSPKTVAATNIGNASLTFSGGTNPSYPADFPVNSSAASLCGAGSSLAAGLSCNVSINFNPTTGGPLSENVVLTDNNLNNSAATQSIPVSGTGGSSLIAQTITFTQPATPVTYSSGLTIPLSATGGGSENPVVFSIDGSSTGAGSISGSTLTVTTPGTFVIDANQAGNSNYSAAPQVQRTVIVNQASQTINFTQPTSPVTYSGTSVNVPLSATGGTSGNAVVFTIDGSSTGTGSISASTLTVTSVGNFVIDANQAGNSSYSAATQVQRTVVANALTAQAITFTQPTTPVTYSSGLTIPLVAAGGASGNPVVFTIDATSTTGAGSISGSTLTVNTPGTIVIDANQAGNSTYSAAPQVQRTLVVGQASQAISFTQPTTPVTYSGTSVIVPLSATGGASGNPVVFTIDGSSTGTGSISSSTLTVTSVGNFVIDANQTGNTDYSAATQVQRTILVNSPNSQAINFTQPATPVTYTSGLTIPLVASGGGSENPVVFTIDTSSTGAGSISGGTVTVTSVGSFVIDANQAGNSTYSAAPQVQRTVVVTQAPQAINFTQPATPVTYSSGLSITLSATGGASGSAVVFSIDASSTAKGTISGSTLTVTSAGNLVIDANQAGNTDYSAAAQVQRTVVVNVPAPDFSVAATPPSQSVAPGGSAMYPITVADVGSAFTGTVTLSVSGLPTGATGSFTPASVTPGSEGGSSTLTVSLPATASAVRPNLWPMATPVLALLFMLPFRRWRKVWRGRLLLLIAGVASLGCAASLTGCGGGFGFTQSQTYTLTITGTSGTDTHSTTVQLTVQQ